jgi:hypothetical protein
MNIVLKFAGSLVCYIYLIFLIADTHIQKSVSNKMLNLSMSTL